MLFFAVTKSDTMKHLVIFASGAGSNAENIIDYFKEDSAARVVAVFTNNPKAGVIDRAKKYNVDTIIFSKEDLATGVVGNLLRNYEPTLIVLAGFLLKIPQNLINAYRGKIINIHPALLPKYGGKGMYGMNVHRAILANKEKETGISIHHVDEQYDSGDLIFQARVPTDDCATAEDIAQKVHDLEHEHFPRILSLLIKD